AGHPGHGERAGPAKAERSDRLDAPVAVSAQRGLNRLLGQLPDVSCDREAGQRDGGSLDRRRAPVPGRWIRADQRRRAAAAAPVGFDRLLWVRRPTKPIIEQRGAGGAVGAPQWSPGLQWLLRGELKRTRANSRPTRALALVPSAPERGSSPVARR